MSVLKKSREQYFKYIPLLKELVKRDFRMKYKRSYLGILWSLLDPLLNMIIMTVIFSTLFHNSIKNFPVYLMAGRLILQMFTQATNMSLTAFTSGGMYIKSVRMPFGMLPLSKCLTALVNEAVALLALFIIMLITHTELHLTLLLMPLPILYVFFFSLGIGMMLATWMVYFRDLSHLYGVITTMLLYLTPVFYPVSIYPEKIAWLFKLNPMYHIVLMMRNVTLYGVIPTWTDNMICLAYCAGALIIGAAVLRKGKNSLIVHL